MFTGLIKETGIIEQINPIESEADMILISLTTAKLILNAKLSTILELKMTQPVIQLEYFY